MRYAAVAATIAMAVFFNLAMATFATRPAMANPEMAKKTGQPCAKCHTAPPALNSYGKKYKDGQKK